MALSSVHDSNLRDTRQKRLALRNTRDFPAEQSALSGTKHMQVSLLGNRDVVQGEPKATEQVAYLLRQIQKKGQIFLPLELVKDKAAALVYRENRSPPENSAGTVVFSKNGFVSVAGTQNQRTDFISNDQYIEDGVTNQILKEIPFFKKFQPLRFFKQWKTTMRLNAYERKRQKLAENLLFARPVFSERYPKLIPALNAISDLTLIEIQPNVTYGEKQQTTFEERCRAVLETNKLALTLMVTEIKTQMEDLKRDIIADDERFEDAVKENKVQEMIKSNKNKEELIMFSKQRAKMEALEEQNRLKRLRHSHYDQLLFMVCRYWAAKVVDILFTSKRNFNSTFGNAQNSPQFEVSICFSAEGILDSEPTMERHLASFKKAFEDTEQAIFKNNSLQNFVLDLNDLFFAKSSAYTRNVFDNMQAVIAMNKPYQRQHADIFGALKRHIDDCLDKIASYRHLQDIHDFCLNWNLQSGGDRSSFEMGFYKETWKKMDEFNEMIRKVPAGSPKAGSILMETNTLKKQLAEMPKQVSESIK